MGWGPILFGVALIAATTAAIRRRLIDSNAGAFRRLIAGPVLLGGAAVAAISLIQFGVRLRTSVPVIAAQPEPIATGSAAPSPAAPAATRVAAPSPVPAPAAPAPATSGALVIERAPPELVAQTIPKGVIALEELKERYPNDPAVLEPLAIGYSKQPGGELQALEILEKLFVIAPNKVHDKELEKIVMKTAVGSGYLATRALDLMAQRMGRRGADLLYDLFVTSANLRVPARERLDMAKETKHFSPALAVAYDLRTADGCEARVPMLERASKFGDERSIAVLQMLGNRTKKGCGYKKRQACPPPCAAQATAFRKTSSDIQKRMTAEGKR
jgi:hypothetical protein